ncbi:MAG: hypothetical protein LBP35_03430 [Candidatus Ancillula trichonymphae]|jgi:hypothetical protein|nr:hypothetical protein [Candidatus Ancillula trichonymphae]
MTFGVSVSAEAGENLKVSGAMALDFGLEVSAGAQLNVFPAGHCLT